MKYIMDNPTAFSQVTNGFAAYGMRAMTIATAFVALPGGAYQPAAMVAIAMGELLGILTAPEWLTLVGAVGGAAIIIASIKQCGGAE